MKVRLIGAGAVGAVAGKFISDFSDFALIVDEERKERYSRMPFIINGETTNFRLETPEEAEKADLLLVAVKNFDLDKAMETMAPFVGNETTILSLSNGIGGEEILASRFGKEKVLYGYTKVSSVHKGNVITASQMTITFGEKDNRKTPRVLEIQNLLEKSGLKVVVPDDIQRQQWLKFMLNVFQNSLSAILRCNYGEMEGNEAYKKAAKLIALEVLAVGQAEGINLTEKDVEKLLAPKAVLSPEGKSSTLQDVEAGRRTENAYFCGEVSRLGRKHGIPTPYNDITGLLVDASSNITCHRMKQQEK